MSILTPMRNRSRMPFFTHGLTRQPVAAAGSGSAARMLPAVRAARNCVNSSRSAAVSAAGLWSKRFSILARNGSPSEQPGGLQHAFDFTQVVLAGWHHGEAPYGFQQTHQRHRGFHRNGVGLHEVDIHEGEEFRLN